ncbi:MAG: site-2 protease family protein [Chloroflexota bacterium]
MFTLPSIAEIILRALCFLIAMDVHEFAHAYAAYRMGDTTARDSGRMTLNPFVNINWIGFLMAIAIGFGILGSAPVNEYRMRNRRWGMLVAVLAGPVANLLLAIVCSIPFWFGLRPDFPGPKDFFPTFPAFLFNMVWLNLILFIFNLIPLFPLDGWTILLKLVPPDLGSQLARYQQQSMYVFYALILLSFIGIPQLNILSAILNPPLNFLLQLLIPVLRGYV